MNMSRHAAWGLGLALSLGRPVDAQVRLEAPAVFPEPFSRIVGVRELEDGRVIVADRLERHVSYLDFATGTVTQISREGEGPGEYRQPLGLHPYANGGTLLTDIGNMRISLIDGRGVIGTSWPMMRQGEDGSMSFVRPSGVDADGAVYFSGANMVLRTPSGRGAAPPDSSYVVRLNLTTGASDTVVSLYAGPAAGGAGGTRIARGGRAVNISGGVFRPFPSIDGWGVAPDGRIAVVRATEYRVDWYDADGTVHHGPPTTYQPVRVGQPEKERWADGRASGFAMALDGGRGGGSFRLPRPDIDEVEFPEVMPPFASDAVAVSPTGEVWVRLNQPASETSPRFDIFDSTGRKVRQVELPVQREFVGFGRGVVYAVAIDDDDLQWLEKYPYP